MADAKGSVDIPSIAHDESGPQQKSSRWKVSKTGGGDTAMALFNDPEEVDEELDPKELRKLLWRIDFMILPYLAVCYAFFYIDKACNSILAL